jgi:EmrB/QacA subfamily drug resistance transporter
MNLATVISKGDAHGKRWYALAVLCMVLLIISIDNTVLNLALPSISKGLGATASQLQWIVDAYTLVFASLLLTTGSIGDRYGRRRMLKLGLALFGLGSLGAALSTTTMMLIAFRALLGVAGAMVMPSTLSIITDVFREPGERAKAIAIWSSIFSIGAGVGPLVGGYLLSIFNWSSVFYLNLPIVAIGLIGGFLVIPESRDETVPRPDVPGVLLSIGGLVSLVYAIIRAGEHGWQASEVLLTFAAAVALLAALIWWENRSPHPMLPLEFFKNMAFTGSNIALTLSAFGMMGSIYFFSQYFQSVHGYTPLVAALAMLPMTIIIFPSTIMSVKVDRKLGTNKTVGLGLFLAGCGLLMFSLVVGVDTPYIAILGVLVLLASGLSIIMSPATNAIMGSLPVSRAGIGSAMNDTTRQVGGALGVAVLGALMNTTYRTEIDGLSVMGSLPAGLAEAVRSGIQSAQVAAANLPADVAEAVLRGTSQAFVDGMSRALLIGALTMFVGGLAALFVIPARVKRSPHPQG